MERDVLSYYHLAAQALWQSGPRAFKTEIVFEVLKSLAIDVTLRHATLATDWLALGEPRT